MYSKTVAVLVSLLAGKFSCSRLVKIQVKVVHYLKRRSQKEHFFSPGKSAIMSAQFLAEWLICPRPCLWCPHCGGMNMPRPSQRTSSSQKNLPRIKFKSIYEPRNHRGLKGLSLFTCPFCLWSLTWWSLGQIEMEQTMLLNLDQWKLSSDPKYPDFLLRTILEYTNQTCE